LHGKVVFPFQRVDVECLAVQHKYEPGQLIPEPHTETLIKVPYFANTSRKIGIERAKAARLSRGEYMIMKKSHK
jgi:hypothetical protein